MPCAPVKVCVVGSLMTDLVLRLPRLPLRGETLLADQAGQFLGGKGFNQAVAARRLGAEVALIGRVGDDAFGHAFLAALDREGIDRSGLSLDKEEGTGMAIPLVEPDGANTIVVAPRANRRITPSDIDRGRRFIEDAAVLLVQCEIAPEATLAAVRIARSAGRLVLLNPAPAPTALDDLLAEVDIVTPNEREAEALLGLPVRTLADAERAAERLHQPGGRVAVITLGEQGAMAASDGAVIHSPTYAVKAVDTTAAGDAFSAALAVRLAEGAALPEALRWANAAGAHAVTIIGAQPSLPERAALERILAHTT